MDDVIGFDEIENDGGGEISVKRIENKTRTPSFLFTDLPPLLCHCPPSNAFPTPTCKYSISDQDLETRVFFLRRTISDLNLDHLNSVFIAVGFPRRDPEKIKLALEHTESMFWVEYKKTQKPVAFARATGDGVFNAILWPLHCTRSQGNWGSVRIRPLGFVADHDGIRRHCLLKRAEKKK